jgi:hypothetical protein
MIATTLKRTPRKQDCATGIPGPILPPGKVGKSGSEEEYRQDWRNYIAKTCGSVCIDLAPQQRISVREGVLRKLYENKYLENIARNPQRLEQVTKNYAKNLIKDLTPIRPVEPVNKKSIPSKRPGFLKTLACACTLTALGTVAGVVVHDAYQAWSNGREYNPAQRLNEIVSIFKEAK